jgi:deoxycytidylate deaminase
MSKVAIGVTGSFGSGCTTVTQVLTEHFEFKNYSLSVFLKEEWSRQHNGESAENAPREELQDLGNKLRKEKSLSILASEVYEKVKKDNNQDRNLVFDSIRNPAEIAFFRSIFPDFYVLAVDCTEADRWERVRPYYEKYKKTKADFLKDDDRDKNEDGIIYGQQVALCVDEADYLIRNDNEPMVMTPRAIKGKLAGKLEDPVKLFQGTLRPPTEKEAYMSVAYAASLLSHCFKRQVGAVIIDDRGIVVSIGYNENSKPLKPCYDEFGDCYREMYAEQIMTTFKACPLCKKELDGLTYPYRCPHCQRSIYHEVVRDRALGRCTALHAEEKAIINASSASLGGCTLYVTTFPCFTCAQKILNSDIQSICYVESYPDVDSIKLFETAGKKGKTIMMDKFEGVKARTYFKLFSAWRREKETQMLKARPK